MTEVSISVLTDPDPSHAGEAILRLTGVALVPPGSTYRIDPIDDDGPGEPPDGWPSGELKPSAQRITHDGVDLVIGSDVVEAAALLPGTPVTITVPSVGAKAELRWPSLPVGKPARRAAVVVSGEQRAAELAARAASERAAAARAELEREEAERTARLKTEVEVREAATAQMAKTEGAARKSQTENGLSSLSLSPETPAKARSAGSGAASDVLATLKPIGETGQLATSASVVPVPPKPAPPKPLAAAALAIRPGSSAAGASRAPHPLVPEPSLGETAPRTVSQSWGLSAAAFVLGGLLVGVSMLMWPSPAPPRSAPTAVASRTPTEFPPADRTGSFATPRLAEILTVPDLSPLGQPAGGITLEEALRRADQGLYGADGIDPDRREAKYWLRKALSIGLGDDRLLWAMTQLGTLYAAPDGEAPDYTSARLLWELAGAKGDPVALCFLASVFESGLGVSKDTRRALELYEQARGNGGCKGIEDAIARLRKAIP